MIIEKDGLMKETSSMELDKEMDAWLGQVEITTKVDSKREKHMD